MRLRSHVFILVAATLAPVLVFAAIGSVLFVRYERETFQRGAMERTLALVTAVDSVLRGSVTTLQGLAALPSLERDDLRAFHAQAAGLLRSQEDWLTINLALLSGEQVVNVLSPYGTPLMTIPERPSFNRVLATKQPAIGSLVLGRFTDAYDFAVRVPVLRDGTPVYVLSAFVSPRAIDRLLAAQRLPAEWVGVVLDGNARIVSRTVKPEQTVGRWASESLRDALAERPEGWFRGSTIEGAPVYTPFNRSSFSGWTVALGIPASAVDAAAWRTTVTLLAGVLGAAMSAALVALWLAQRLTAPVAALAASANAMGRGERVEVPISARIAEVGDLGLALHRAAAAVHAREEVHGRLAAIVESSGDAIISYSPDGTILTWNAAASRLFGYEADEIVSRHVSVLVPPTRRDEIARVFAAAGRGEATTLDTERVRKDGSFVPVALNISPIRGAGGVVTGVSAVLHDISERVHAEARLRASEQRIRESEERLRLALVGAGQGTWEWDLRTHQLMWDERCKALFGLPPELPVTYDRQIAALHPDDREHVIKAAFAAVEGRSDFSEEYRVFWPDGSMHWVLAKGRASYDDAGEPLRMSGVALDVTERKRAEEALRAADRAKDEFLAMLGHELRNPLGAIAAARALLDVVDPRDERAQAARAVIGRQVQHLSRLVDDLLDVSRVSSGKILLRRRRFDLAAHVTAIANVWRTAGRFERHEVALDASSTWVDADDARIEQILDNLVGNALKYTPPGGRVTVRVAPEGDVSVLEVLDTGVGLAPSLVDRVFEPFVQGERTLDRSQGGLGLGLSLVKGLVVQHGGTVRAMSPGLGQGSTFTVRLPRVSPAAPAPSPSLPLADRPSRRVLVIEDNADAREMLVTMLTMNGHEVHAASNGRDGIELAAAVHPHVALVDVGLPGLDGYEVARRLRADGRGAAMRLVAITGYGQADDRRRAEVAGFDVHLVKPVDPDMLIAAITGQ
jgi:PAS domain S-box-containing protein